MSLVRIAAACSVVSSQLAIADTTKPTLEGITDAYVRKYCTGWTKEKMIARRSAERTYHGISAAIDRAGELLKGALDAFDRRVDEATKVSKLEEILNGYLITGKSFRLTPAQLNYRMLVAMFFLRAVESMRDLSETLRSASIDLQNRLIDDNLLVKMAGKGKKEWWMHHGDDGDDKYNPTDDVNKYWNDMKLEKFFCDRLGTVESIACMMETHLEVRTIADADLRTGAARTIVISEEHIGTPLVCACQLFALNRDEGAVCLPDSDSAADQSSASGLAKETSIELRALRSIVSQLKRSRRNINLDVELGILAEAYSKDKTKLQPQKINDAQKLSGAGVEAASVNGINTRSYYEFLRQRVLKIGSDKDVMSLELNSSSCARVVTEVNESRTVKTCRKARRLVCNRPSYESTLGRLMTYDVTSVLRNQCYYMIDGETAKGVMHEEDRALCPSESQPGTTVLVGAKAINKFLKKGQGREAEDGMSIGDLPVCDCPTLIVNGIATNAQIIVPEEIMCAGVTNYLLKRIDYSNKIYTTDPRKKMRLYGLWVMWNSGDEREATWKYVGNNQYAKISGAGSEGVKYSAVSDVIRRGGITNLMAIYCDTSRCGGWV
jgi:hypothetical protein